MEKTVIEKLIDIAIRQLDFSYSPYSDLNSMSEESPFNAQKHN